MQQQGADIFFGEKSFEVDDLMRMSDDGRGMINILRVRVMFIEEAHLVFNEASQALLDQIETILKLIRSKGIGIFFCTQNPMDVPASVLAQLGMKV